MQRLLRLTSRGRKMTNKPKNAAYAKNAYKI